MAKWWTPTALPGGALLWQGVNGLASLAIVTLLFAVIYKMLPDVELCWSDVWAGAAVTALLFTAGKLLIGFYLGQAGPGSLYGAAGSLVVVLIWVYYSAQLVLYGAEFTRLYAERFGSKCRGAAAEAPRPPAAARPAGS